jgi:hypothetical protein
MAQAHHIEIEDNEGFQARLIGFVGNMEFMHRFGGIFNPRQAPDVEVQFIGGGAVHMADPLADNLPNLDYRGNGGGGGDRAPKPAFVPPPPAREGFTRDLGGEDDETLVCPGCEKELHYDPDADNVPAAKKAKTARASRKDQEEHHFWALKECGHVSSSVHGLFLALCLFLTFLSAHRSIAGTVSTTASRWLKTRLCTFAREGTMARKSSVPLIPARLMSPARAIGSASFFELSSLSFHQGNRFTWRFPA